jgi:hypothetical protein
VTVDPQQLPFGTWREQFTFTRHFWAKLLEGSRYPPFYRSDVPWSAVPDECRARNTGWLIANVLVLFVAVVGPVNWAVLSHKKRKEWVVFTAPATAFVFLVILAVVGLVIHTRQPQQVFQSINLCTSGCDGAGAVRIHGVLATGTGDYDLAFDRRDAVIGEFRQDVQAYAGGVAPGTWFTLGESAALPRVSTYRWAMRLFFDTGLSPDGSVDGRVWLGEDGLSGYVENRLPVALEGCVLIHKWNHTAVGDIPPGERRELSLDLGPPKVSDYKLSRLSAQTDLSSWLDPELWAGEVADRGWELARVAARGVGYRLIGPMLLGWGESLTEAPTSTSREYCVKEKHLFVVRLPIVARGPELTVPVGGAICADHAIASRWLLTYPLQREAYRPSEDPAGQLEFQLPLGEPTAHHRELTVCGRLDPMQEDSEEQAQQLQMYDWQKREWVVISDAVDESFSYTVQEPERFIRMPAGLVRVAVHTPGDEYGYYSRLVWVDLEYRGEAAGR